MMLRIKKIITHKYLEDQDLGGYLCSVNNILTSCKGVESLITGTGGKTQTNSGTAKNLTKIKSRNQQESFVFWGEFTTFAVITIKR